MIGGGPFSLGDDVDEEKGFTKDELIIYKLGRIETLLNEVRDNTKEKITDHDDRLTKVEARLDKYDNLKSWGLGVIAVLTVIVSLAKDLLFKWLNLT